jgi:hypothetical protein
MHLQTPLNLDDAQALKAVEARVRSRLLVSTPKPLKLFDEVEDLNRRKEQLTAQITEIETKFKWACGGKKFPDFSWVSKVRRQEFRSLLQR